MNTAEEEDMLSVKPHWLNLIPKVCSVSYEAFLSYRDANGIVNIAGALGGIRAPWGCQQGD